MKDSVSLAYAAENLSQDFRVFSLTVAQFKAAKKAIRVLTNAGMAYNEAVAFLLTGRFGRNQ